VHKTGSSKIQKFKDSRGSDRSALYANTPVYPVRSIKPIQHEGAANTEKGYVFSPCSLCLRVFLFHRRDGGTGLKNDGIGLKGDGFKLKVGGIEPEDGGIRLEDGRIRLEDGGIRSEEDGIRLEDDGIRSEDGRIRLEDDGIRSEDNGTVLKNEII
jgi:hypothetical protein